MVNFWQALSCRCKKLALTYSENCDTHREVNKRGHLDVVLLSSNSNIGNKPVDFSLRSICNKSMAFRTIFFNVIGKCNHLFWLYMHFTNKIMKQKKTNIQVNIGYNLTLTCLATTLFQHCSCFQTN